MRSTSKGFQARSNLQVALSAEADHEVRRRQAKLYNSAIGVWTPSEESPRHMEVHEAFIPLARYLRLLGMLPLYVDADDTKLPLLRFRLCSWLTAYSAVPLMLLAGSCWMAVNMYGVNISNPVERSTTIIYFISSIAFGELVIASAAFRAHSHRQYVNAWKRVDTLLGVASDLRLRRFGRQLATVFLLTMLFGLAMTAGIVAMRVLRRIHSSVTGKTHGGPSQDLAGNDVIVVPIAVWLTYNMGAFTLPDLCFLFYSRAARLRLGRLRRRLLALTTSGRRELSGELQLLRIGYRAVLGMVPVTCLYQSPTLLLSCLANGVQISMSAYGLVLKQESPNMAWLALKISMGMFGFIKFAMICFAGGAVTDAAKEVISILKRSSTVNVSRATKFEVNMFIADALNPNYGFTVSGFFSVNLAFLSTIVGVVLTYIITIVQFDQTSSQCAAIANDSSVVT